ncbi:MAG: DNA translocase FtsK, partial [Limisphaerales bacterium]
AEEGEGEDEDLIEQCIEVIRSEQKASVSLLQRRLKIGYGRAARIMDVLEERGYVGPSKGAEPRDILIDLDGEGHDGAGQQAV